MLILQSRRLIAELERFKALLPNFGRNVEKVFLLDYDDVLEAHFCIADFFVEQDYGMGGIGPRDINIFVSTVERQWTGFAGTTVYNTEYERIASLMYGIIKNHPFHDGNKRTAFLCSLLQLHRMGRVITVPQKELEDLMVDVASNQFLRKRAVRNLVKSKAAHPEIKFLGRYLEKHSRKSARLEKRLKFRDLRAIINKHGFDFKNPLKGTIDIIKTEQRRVDRFWRSDKFELVDRQVGQVAYHGEGVDVPDNTIKYVRQICGLTDQDGFDGEVLLRDAQPTFQLISSYRESLQRLAYR